MGERSGLVSCPPLLTRLSSPPGLCLTSGAGRRQDCRAEKAWGGGVGVVEGGLCLSALLTTFRGSYKMSIFQPEPISFPPILIPFILLFSKSLVSPGQVPSAFSHLVTSWSSTGLGSPFVKVTRFTLFIHSDPPAGVALHVPATTNCLQNPSLSATAPAPGSGPETQV